jgi:hypothetical protein
MMINKNTRICYFSVTNMCTTTPEIDTIIILLTSNSDVNQNTRKEMFHILGISLEQITSNSTNKCPPDGPPWSSACRSFTLFPGRTSGLFWTTCQRITSGALPCHPLLPVISNGASNFCTWGCSQQCLYDSGLCPASASSRTCLTSGSLSWVPAVCGYGRNSLTSSRASTFWQEYAFST